MKNITTKVIIARAKFILRESGRIDKYRKFLRRLDYNCLQLNGESLRNYMTYSDYRNAEVAIKDTLRPKIKQSQRKIRSLYYLAKKKG